MSRVLDVHGIIICSFSTVLSLHLYSKAPQWRTDRGKFTGAQVVLLVVNRPTGIQLPVPKAQNFMFKWSRGYQPLARLCTFIKPQGLLSGWAKKRCLFLHWLPQRTAGGVTRGPDVAGNGLGRRGGWPHPPAHTQFWWGEWKKICIPGCSCGHLPEKPYVKMEWGTQWQGNTAAPRYPMGVKSRTPTYTKICKWLVPYIKHHHICI